MIDPEHERLIGVATDLRESGKAAAAQFVDMFSNDCAPHFHKGSKQHCFCDVTQP